MTKESDPSMVAIVSDSRVLTRDGEEIGTVSDVVAGHFKVDAPMSSDFWLSKRIVASADDESVLLDYDKEQLEPFKLEEPAAAAESPIADAQAESFADEEEQRERRAAMRAGGAFDLGDERRDTE